MRKHSFVSKAGMILPLLILCACAVGFLFAPNDPELVDLTKKFLAPCPEFPLGADNLGRCVLSRLLYGGRTTLGIVLVGSVTVSVFGTLIGLLMGSGKNGKNLILEGVLNAVTAIPPIAYLIIFIAAWGNSVFTMVVAVSASLMLRVIKLVQTRTEIEQGKAYVMCAVASGAKPSRILFVHILPNLIWDVLHFICLSCADMILAITGFDAVHRQLFVYRAGHGRQCGGLGQHGVGDTPLSALLSRSYAVSGLDDRAVYHGIPYAGTLD